MKARWAAKRAAEANSESCLERQSTFRTARISAAGAGKQTRRRLARANEAVPVVATALWAFLIKLFAFIDRPQAAGYNIACGRVWYPLLQLRRRTPLISACRGHVTR
jgi:hypothetical protein